MGSTSWPLTFAVNQDRGKHIGIADHMGKTIEFGYPLRCGKGFWAPVQKNW